MAHRITVSPEHRLVFVRMAGDLTVSDFFAARTELINRPDFDPTFRLILDLRAAGLSDLTTTALRDLAQSSTFAPDARLAFITNTEMQYGLSRMYQTLRELAGRGDGLRLFVSVTEALSWLGLNELDAADIATLVAP